jgi:putative membrane protein
MMGFGLIFLVLFFGVVAYLFGWRPNEGQDIFGRSSGYKKTPMEILKDRYAKGEIPKEEYEKMRDDLKND